MCWLSQCMKGDHDGFGEGRYDDKDKNDTVRLTVHCCDYDIDDDHNEGMYYLKMVCCI